MGGSRKGILGVYALEISIIYLIVDIAWVLFTNIYLDNIFQGRETLLIAKGILFAIVSAVFLFLTIRHYELSIKRSSEAFQMEERKFRELFENANDAIFFYELLSDDLTSTFIEVNRLACEQLGYTREELLGLSRKDIVEESNLKEYISVLKENMEKGSFVTESSHIAKDGRVIPCELSSRVFEWGGKKVVLSSVRYIADRKRMEEVLRESEAKYRLIADNMSDLIGVLDVNGVFHYASPSHETIMGFSPKDYEGISVFHFIHAEDVSEVQEKLETLFKTKEPKKAEFRYLHADGRWVIIEARATPVVDEHDNVEKVVVVSRDITEQKLAEEQLLWSEKLAVVGELAAGVAHEIRNPLTSLKGFLQLLAQNEANANYCSIMLSELDRINGIVSEFLMIAKPQVQILQPTSIQEVLHDVIELLDTNAIMNNVQITFEYGASIPLVTGDENQLKQVFINILKNAIDAMPNGGEVSVEVHMHGENNVIIRMIDRGCGIPKERLSKIGEPFYTTKEKGTGLGMMVSKRIIEAHNGKITIMSEEGVGTVVDIVLPIQQG